MKNSSTSNSRTLLYTLLSIVLIVLSINYLGVLYKTSKNENAINEKSNRRFDDFYALPDNSLDMVFVGSSHSYCSFDPEIFDDSLGTSSFQLGMPLQHPDGTYYTVREVFNYQRPKLVVVEVYWDVIDDDVEIKQALTLFDSLKNKELEKEYVGKVFNLSEKIKYNMDIINYQKDYFTLKNTELKDFIKKSFKVFDKGDQQKGEEYYRSKGYVYCNYTINPDEFGRTNQFNGLNGRNYEISSKQRVYLMQIVDLCRENGSEVVFVTAPIANVSLKKIDGYEFINKKVSKMAEEFNVPYLDYNLEEIRQNMFMDANFRDDAHLNDSGVKILDRHFVTWLKKFEYFSY